MKNTGFYWQLKDGEDFTEIVKDENFSKNVIDDTHKVRGRKFYTLFREKDFGKDIFNISLCVTGCYVNFCEFCYRFITLIPIFQDDVNFITTREGVNYFDVIFIFLGFIFVR